MHSTFSQSTPPVTTQPYNFTKLQNFWYRGKSPRWQPENFTVSNDILQNKDSLTNQAEQVFYHYDTNRTGFLEKREFKKAIQALGYDKLKSKQVGRLVDRDINGRIGIEEFVNAFLYLRASGGAGGGFTSSTQPFNNISGQQQQQPQQPYLQGFGSTQTPPLQTTTGGIPPLGGQQQQFGGVPRTITTTTSIGGGQSTLPPNQLQQQQPYQGGFYQQ